MYDLHIVIIPRRSSNVGIELFILFGDITFISRNLPTHEFWAWAETYYIRLKLLDTKLAFANVFVTVLPTNYIDIFCDWNENELGSGKNGFRPIKFTLKHYFFIDYFKMIIANDNEDYFPYFQHIIYWLDKFHVQNVRRKVFVERFSNKSDFERFFINIVQFLCFRKWRRTKRNREAHRCFPHSRVKSLIINAYLAFLIVKIAFTFIVNNKK